LEKNFSPGSALDPTFFSPLLEEFFKE